MELTMPVAEEASSTFSDIVHISSCLCPDSTWTICGLLDDSPLVDEIEAHETLCIVCDELELNGYQPDCSVCS